ncbi:MAG TPA: substrate-binding domain-containing protein [Conexibacter sp.]|nr:substrate-binding domain-containing protein [Conexibacter sp.]
MRRYRGAWALALAAALCLMLAACGSNSSSGSGSGGSGSGSTAASTTGASNATIAEAKALLDKARTRPTQIPTQTPVGKPIPTGKTLSFISCGNEDCTNQAKVVKQATDILGWKLIVHNTDGTPPTLKSAFDQVVREKPDGLIYNATDRSLINNELLQLQALKIPAAACCILQKPGQGITFVSEGPQDEVAKGKVMAAWFVVDSGGKGSTVYVDIPDFKILAPLGDGYVNESKRLCPACSAARLEIPFTSLGKDAPNRIVSYLRAHPDVKYVALAIDQIGTGLPAALKAAGLGDVKLIGESPTATSYQYIRSGLQSVTAVYDMYGDMFSQVDAVARALVGVPQVQSSPNVWLVDKDNILADQGVFPMVADNNAQYAKVWGR